MATDGMGPGTRLGCAVCGTEVILIRVAAGAEVRLECGSDPMGPPGVVPGGAPGGHVAAVAEVQIGKRYADPDSQVEVLCTKAGAGSLSLGQVPLQQVAAKALPSSD